VWKIELTIRDWARRDAHVADRLRRLDNRRMDYMRQLFGSFCADEDEVEVCCTLVMSLFIANRFLAADHGAHRRSNVLRMALDRLIG
jgi:hypothetical protein